MSGNTEKGILDRFQSTDEMLAEVLKGQDGLMETFQGLEPAMNNLADAIRSGDTAPGNVIERSIQRAFTGELVPIPTDQSLQVFPASDESDPVQFDMVNGKTRVPGVGEFTGGGINTLAQLNRDHAFSGALYVSGPVTVKLYDKSETVTGTYAISGAGFLTFSNTPVAMIEMYSDVAVKVGGALSTAIQSPLDPDLLSLEINSFGYVSQTEDTPVPVPLIPYADGVAEDFKVANIEQAAIQFGSPVIPAGTYTTQSWIVSNTGANDVDVQVQGYDVQDEQIIADTDIHASTDTATEFITVAAGDTSILESSLQLGFKQMITKNSALGSPSTIRVQHNGLVPGVRG